MDPLSISQRQGFLHVLPYLDYLLFLNLFYEFGNILQEKEGVCTCACLCVCAGVRVCVTHEKEKIFFSWHFLELSSMLKTHVQFKAHE